MNAVNIDTALTPFDVLLGRGEAAARNMGNIIFRQVGWTFRRAYLSSPKREKRSVALKVIKMIHELGGRFLEVQDGDGVFQIITPERCIEKTCQMLRERTARQPFNRKENVDRIKKIMKDNLIPRSIMFLLEECLGKANRGGPCSESMFATSFKRSPSARRRRLSATQSVTPPRRSKRLKRVLDAIAASSCEKCSDAKKHNASGVDSELESPVKKIKTVDSKLSHEDHMKESAKDCVGGPETQLGPEGSVTRHINETSIAKRDINRGKTMIRQVLTSYHRLLGIVTNEEETATDQEPANTIEAVPCTPETKHSSCKPRHNKSVSVGTDKSVLNSTAATCPKLPPLDFGVGCSSQANNDIVANESMMATLNFDAGCTVFSLADSSAQLLFDRLVDTDKSTAREESLDEFETKSIVSLASVSGAGYCSVSDMETDGDECSLKWRSDQESPTTVNFDWMLT